MYEEPPGEPGFGSGANNTPPDVRPKGIQSDAPWQSGETREASAFKRSVVHEE